MSSQTLNVTSIIKAREEASNRVPAFLNSLAEKYESVTSKLGEVMSGDVSTGYVSVLKDNVIKYFNISEIKDLIDNKSQQVNETIIKEYDATGNYVESTGSECIGILTENYTAAKANAIMYKELAVTKLTEIIDTSSIISRIQAALGSVQIPTATRSLVTALPNKSSVAQWCSAISATANLPTNTETGWNFGNYGISTGNAITAAINAIGADIASFFDILSKGLSKLWEAIKMLGSVVKQAINFIGEKFFGNLKIDYEYDQDGQWPSCDVPISTITWPNISQFLENFRQISELGSTGEVYLSNDYQIHATNRKYDVGNGLVSTWAIPNAYIQQGTDKALSWYAKLQDIITTKKNLTVYYNFWMIRAVVLSDGKVQVGFFPSTYYPIFDVDDTANQGICTNLVDSFGELQNITDQNQLFWTAAVGTSRAYYNLLRNLPICYCQYWAGAHYDTGWDNFLKDNDMILFSNNPSLIKQKFIDTSAPSTYGYGSEGLIKSLKFREWRFGDVSGDPNTTQYETFKAWLEYSPSISTDDKIRLTILNMLCYYAARSLADDPEIQLGHFTNHAYTYEKWVPEGSYDEQLVLIPKASFEVEYWFPYTTIEDVTYRIHLQTNDEIIAEWKGAITKVIIAAAIIVATIAIFKLKKTIALKQQIADVGYFNAADSYLKNPSRANLRALNKARKSNKFWTKIGEKLTGGSSLSNEINEIFAPEPSEYDSDYIVGLIVNE